ncbi:MAG TPA: Na-translocating system protein MpsB, partial [Candidatus Melainabacteria bacterium]|nr:Na-translocating system protein MpsB [Candidatus Melainabacteria bacterium]
MKTIGSRTSEIRELVDRASRVVAHYWPMSSFVHHNPIRSLETLRFQEAVRVANRFIGAQGYLANEKYRELVFSGRIESRHLDRAIEAVASKQEIELGERKVSHFEVLRAHLLTGITPPSDDAIASLVDRISNDTRRRIAPSIAYLNDHSGRNGKNS